MSHKRRLPAAGGQERPRHLRLVVDSDSSAVAAARGSDVLAYVRRRLSSDHALTPSEGESLEVLVAGLRGVGILSDGDYLRLYDEVRARIAADAHRGLNPNLLIGWAERHLEKARL